MRNPRDGVVQLLGQGMRTAAFIRAHGFCMARFNPSVFASDKLSDCYWSLVPYRCWWSAAFVNAGAHGLDSQPTLLHRHAFGFVLRVLRLPAVRQVLELIIGTAQASPEMMASGGLTPNNPR